jgi:hypothetical protein
VSVEHYLNIFLAPTEQRVVRRTIDRLRQRKSARLQHWL